MRAVGCLFKKLSQWAVASRLKGRRAGRAAPYHVIAVVIPHTLLTKIELGSALQRGRSRRNRAAVCPSHVSDNFLYLIYY